MAARAGARRGPFRVFQRAGRGHAAYVAGSRSRSMVGFFSSEARDVVEECYTSIT